MSAGPALGPLVCPEQRFPAQPVPPCPCHPHPCFVLEREKASDLTGWLMNQNVPKTGKRKGSPRRSFRCQRRNRSGAGPRCLPFCQQGLVRGSCKLLQKTSCLLEVSGGRMGECVCLPSGGPGPQHALHPWILLGSSCGGLPWPRAEDTQVLSVPPRRLFSPNTKHLLPGPSPSNRARICPGPLSHLFPDSKPYSLEARTGS